MDGKFNYKINSVIKFKNFRDLIEPTLDEIEGKMREAELAPHEGRRKVETLWPIFKIHHQKSRYIYDLYYKRKTISKELYDYCIKQSIGDKNLIGT
jgi:bud site selection protein 31